MAYSTSMQGGCTPSKKNDEFWIGDTPWVTPKDMKRFRIADSIDHVSESALTETGLRLLPAGVVLIVVRGMILAHTFPVAVTAARVTVNQDMKALVPEPDIDSTFLAYQLRGCSSAFFAIVEESGHGTRVLRTDLWRRVQLPVPPLDEQQAIAAFLDRGTARIDELITKKRRLIELLAEKRTTLIDNCVTRGLNSKAHMKPSQFAWLTEVPAHWKVRTFRYSARIPNGQVDPELPEFCDLPLVAPNYIESGTGRLLGMETAAEQAAESGKYMFEAGSILYSKIRPALAKVCMAPVRGLCSADMYPITPTQDLRSKFLMYFMLSRTFTSAVILMSDRVAMPKINRRDLGAFPILVPPLPEQDEIIEAIEHDTAWMDALREKEETAIQTLRDYRFALISAAVTGKIDVRREA